MIATTTAPLRTPCLRRLFPSLFMAGFECATGKNSARQSIDQIAATQHDRCVVQDYERLLEVGIRTVREGIRWPLVDRGGELDFSSVTPFLRASRALGITPIWDLFHYGYPEGEDPFNEGFVERFAAYCGAVARYLARHVDGPHYLTPVNEISYFSWAGGHSGLFAPHAVERGYELKVNLARAAIRGIDAIRAVLPEARIVNADPLCRVAPPIDRSELAGQAEYFNEVAVFEAWDMLAGRLLPELGGSPEHLDLVGINYYWTNQWEHGHPGVLVGEGDPRYVPLRELIRTVWRRYGHEMLITETSHVNEHRAPWLRQVALDVEDLWEDGIPLHGVCLYPVLGMPEWHFPDVWTRMGLWDLHPAGDTLQRVPCDEMLAALADAKRLERHPMWRAHVR